MKSIPIDRIIVYLRAYDEFYGNYPEHPYEGAAVGKWILERVLDDTIITEEEFLEWDVYDDN